MQLKSGPDLMRLPVDTSGFIKDLSNSLHHSFLWPWTNESRHLKPADFVCSWAISVLHLLNSFALQVLYSFFGFNSTLPLPSGSGGGVKENQGGERTTRSGGGAYPSCIEKGQHFQTCIMESCGNSVIKTWMSLRGCGLQSIFHRSLGPSLLIDWSPGAAAPFCKVHCIITQQKYYIFNELCQEFVPSSYTHKWHLYSGDFLRERKEITVCTLLSQSTQSLCFFLAVFLLLFTFV